jgi:hypothetical protein
LPPKYEVRLYLTVKSPSSIWETQTTEATFGLCTLSLFRLWKQAKKLPGEKKERKKKV